MSTLKTLRNLMITSVTAATLVGCVPHLTQQQCLSINWYQMGLSDGSQGKFQRSLQQDILDCAKFKLTVNTAQYHKGWLAGVRQYCVPNTAYRLGTNGQRYNNICPSDLAPAFNRAWKRGLRVYCVPSTGYNLGRSGRPMPSFCAPSLNVKFSNAYASGFRVYQRVSNLKSDIDNVTNQMNLTQDQIHQKRRDIRHWQNVLATPSTPPVSHQTRRMARQRIRFDYDAINDLQLRLNRLSRHRDFLQNQLTKAEVN